MKDRIKELRKALGLTQQEFADRIGLKRNSVASYEIGKNIPMDAVIFSICREFSVNEEWIRTGQGEMFRLKSDDEEVAEYVSELLEDDGTNPMYAMIKEMMKVYIELEPKSKGLVDDMIKKVFEGMQKKEG